MKIRAIFIKLLPRKEGEIPVKIIKSKKIDG